MDGYPSNARQAELLEGALTGLDLAAEHALIASASRLAPPRPATLPDLTRALPSGPHLILLLTYCGMAVCDMRKCAAWYVTVKVSQSCFSLCC